MIMHEAGVPGRSAATAQTPGGEFNLHASRSLAGAMHGAAADDVIRHAAAEQMRYQLYLLDRSQRRPSIEDYIAAMLEPGSSFEA